MAKSLEPSTQRATAHRSLFNSWRYALAIDLGSQQIRIFQETTAAKQRGERENLLTEAACVARKIMQRPGLLPAKSQILAVGNDALEMKDRLGDEVEVIFPIVAGRIIDQQLAKFLLKTLLKRALKIHRFWPFVMSPVMMVTVKAGTSDFSRQSLVSLLYQLGASEVHIIVEPLAAAIGVGVPVADTAGTLLMQLGAGSVEVAAIALGSLVAFETSLWSGELAAWDIDEALKAYLVKEQHLMIGWQTSEQLKKQLSFSQAGLLTSQLISSQAKTLTVVGRDLVSQQIKTVKLKSSDLAPLLQSVADSYVLMIQRLLKQVPSELLVDILDRGLLLSGDLAKLEHLDYYLSQQLKMPVVVVDDPQLAAARGALTILGNLSQFKNSLAYLDR